MLAGTNSESPAVQPSLRERLRPYRGWLWVGLAILLVVVVRVNERQMPLERDEGEYAYAGQLILQGVPPYRDVYNMKLPGTYAAYALIMAVFGQTPSGIHLGLLLVNVASIVLIYFVGRRLLDETAGVGAAVAFALLSLSPHILGLAAHATHFVVLPALGGLLLLLKGIESRGRLTLFFSGLLFGLGFVMKQHGLFFMIFGFLALGWARLSAERFRFASFFRRPERWLPELALYSAGAVIPYVITCLVLWRAGAFRQFAFWTITYAGTYAAAVPLVDVPKLLRSTVPAMIGPNLLLWILPWIGLIGMWWDPRLRRQGFFVFALLLCSIASVSVGFYYREHYFILLLPVLALLIGAALSRALELLHGEALVELFFGFPIPGRFLAWPVVIFFGLALAVSLIGHIPFWFGLSPDKAMEQIYGTSLWSESLAAGEYIKANSAPNARVAVIGSEPEIYFYAHRRSATGYIYTYPLMEAHAYAAKLQQEMIAEISAGAPDFVVFIETPFSWLRGPNSRTDIFTWFETYRAENLDPVRTFELKEGPKVPPGERKITIYRRKHAGSAQPGLIF